MGSEMCIRDRTSSESLPTVSGKERALNSKKDGVEATEVGRRKEPCRVEVENEGRKVWLHLSTTGGAPFKSVTLSREAA